MGMRSILLLPLSILLIGCGDDDSGIPDSSDTSGGESAEVSTDDAVPPDDAPAPDEVGGDDAVVPEDVSSEAPPEDTAETPDDGGGTCGPHWHPTACGDCGGRWTGDTCSQGCDPASCGDGREYVAECDGTTHTCRCLIDGVEVCTCTSAYGVDVMGCQPEEWGGAVCCWNVG